MRILVIALILVAAAINLAPVVGVVSADLIERTYEVELSSPNLVILMRHRALLFAAVGGLLVASAFRPALRPGAGVVGLGSMLSFVVLAWTTPDSGAPMHRLAAGDVVGSIALVAALALDRFAAPHPTR